MFKVRFAFKMFGCFLCVNMLNLSKLATMFDFSCWPACKECFFFFFEWEVCFHSFCWIPHFCWKGRKMNVSLLLLRCSRYSRATERDMQLELWVVSEHFGDSFLEIKLNLDISDQAYFAVSALPLKKLRYLFCVVWSIHVIPALSKARGIT